MATEYKEENTNSNSICSTCPAANVLGRMICELEKKPEHNIRDTMSLAAMRDTLEGIESSAVELSCVQVDKEIPGEFTGELVMGSPALIEHVTLCPAFENYFINKTGVTVDEYQSNETA